MSHRITQTDDIGAKSFGEARAPMSRPAEATREPVILVFSQRPAARCAADETSPIEGFEHIGEVSVRLLARFTLPRIRLLASSREVDDASA